MPTYDYVCDACGHALEIFHSITEAARRKCPSCGKNKLQRRIGPGAGILFKGTGFYTTDYRSASYKAGEKVAKDAKAPAAETRTSGDAAPTAAADSGPADPKPTDPKPADPGGRKRKAS
jgi:putative FmdB family regulatory protein